MKRCGMCKQTKDESEFNKDRSAKDGLDYRCRECSKEYSREHYQKNREVVMKKQKEYRQNNREARSRHQKEYRQNNREAASRYKKEYYQNHRDVVIEKQREYQLNRRKNDKQFAIAASLRTRLRSAIRLGSKGGSAVRDLGCSIEELLEHLESQFYDERMSLDTWGTEWQIDHIYPLSAADLGDRVQFLAANNWRNLQPLTIAENKSKGSTVTPEAQLLFDELCDMFRKKEEAA